MNNVHIIRRIPLLISSRHHLGCVVGGRHEEMSGTVEIFVPFERPGYDSPFSKGTLGLKHTQMTEHNLIV